MAQYRKRTKVYGIISALLLVAGVIVLISMPRYFSYWSPVLFGEIRVNTLVIYGASALAMFVFFFGYQFKRWTVKDMEAAGITGYSRIGIYGYWIINSFLAFVLFVMPITAKKDPGLRLESRHRGAIHFVEDIRTACTAFYDGQYGQSDDLDEKYLGYPLQTQDLLNVDMKRVINKWDDSSKACAKETENGNVEGYYYRYTVLKKHKDEQSGLMKITDYMICAWPKEVGTSGFWVIIGNSSGDIYKRVLDHVEEQDEMLITEWPSEEELAKNWEMVRR